MYAIRSYYAQFIADQMLDTIGGLGPMAALAGIYLLAALITQPMSNAAAMVLVVPIALDTALSLGANHVITSYSIHYTKLYETHRPRMVGEAISRAIYL